MYALVPAAIGFAIGAYLPFQAWREVADPAVRHASLGRLLVLVALPGSALMFALVATVLTSQDPANDYSMALLAVGAGALTQGAVQGFVARRAMPRVAEDPEAMGRALPLLALPELLTLGPFVYLFLLLGKSL